MRRALAALCFVACSEIGGLPDASEPDAESAAMTLDPDVLLEFGDAPNELESSRDVTVYSTGGEALLIRSIELAAGSAAKWRYTADDVLFGGLAPGESATIRIYFRSCPEAWSGDQIDLGFDFTDCYGDVAAGSIEIESNAGRRALSLSGRADQPDPVVQVEPRGGMRFTWTPGEFVQAWSWLNITDGGYQDLEVSDVELVHGTNNFWFADGCSNPCPIDFDVCQFGREGCVTPLLALQIGFFPPSFGDVDPGEIRIHTNDPNTPELIISIDADPSECGALPSARLDQSRWFVRPGETIRLDAYYSGLPISTYRWTWIYTSTTPPVLAFSDQIRTVFTVEVPGLYAIGVEAENACGWMHSPNIAVLQVRDD